MSQKVSWVFGKAPLSEKMQEANRNAIIDVQNYIENNNITFSTQITDSISWVKGMFNRTIKKDRWDWYTVWVLFGGPLYNDTNSIVCELANLRKAILKNNIQSQTKAIKELINHNFPKYCTNYLSSDSVNTKKELCDDDHSQDNSDKTIARGYRGMKDYISNLSDEELEKYGRIVSGKILKGIFKSNPKEYQSLSYGKRPEALNSEECIALVVKKRKYKFIQTIMNNNADYIVNGTLKHIEENADEETDTDKVLAQSIISFGFDEDVVLFLKLTERPTDEEYVKKITTLIDKIRQETEQEQQAEPEESEEIQTAPDAISEMEIQLAEMEQREQKALEQYEAEKTAHESDAACHKEEVESLKKQLSDSQTKISRLETELNRLIVFDDSEVIRRISSDYQHISLCQLAGYNSYNDLYANRLADVNSMGVIHSSIKGFFEV